jgi:hypothetical protein
VAPATKIRLPLTSFTGHSFRTFRGNSQRPLLGFGAVDRVILSDGRTRVAAEARSFDRGARQPVEGHRVGVGDPLQLRVAGEQLTGERRDSNGRESKLSERVGTGDYLVSTALGLVTPGADSVIINARRTRVVN